MGSGWRLGFLICVDEFLEEPLGIAGADEIDGESTATAFTVAVEKSEAGLMSFLADALDAEGWFSRGGGVALMRNSEKLKLETGKSGGGEFGLPGLDQGGAFLGEGEEALTAVVCGSESLDEPFFFQVVEVDAGADHAGLGRNGGEGFGHFGDVALGSLGEVAEDLDGEGAAIVGEF